MAQSFATAAGVLKIPGAYPIINVQQTNSGLATTGVLFLVGEADAGPDFTLEEDLASNFYGPNQIGDVQMKYKTGRLVDAFNGAAVAANDSQIPGAPAGFVLVKTNPSTKASAGLDHWDASDYATLQDRSYGKLGNLISYQVTAEDEEVVPTTGLFAMLLPIASTNISLRVNGAAVATYTIAALDTPATTAAGIGGLTGIDVTGGAAVALISSAAGSDTLALTVLTGNKVQIDRSIDFDALPEVGDTLFIPSGSVIQGASNENRGSYIVTGVSDDQILATKLLDITGAHDALTPPANVAAVDIGATTDVQAWGAMAIHLIESVDPIDGYGKNLQVNELTSASGLLSDIAWINGTSAPEVVDWISTEDEPHLIVSASEYRATLTESRQLDGITSDLTAGGAIALKLGYEGTTATAEIDGSDITLVTTGGLSAGTLTVSLTDFETIADLAAYIDSVAGFTAEPGTAVLGSQPSVTLDQGTFGICSTFEGLTPGRIKQDAYKFFTTLRDNGALTELDEQADSGLPAPTDAVAFLTGGAKGATSDADIQAAFDALKMVRGNFLIPLFSRDASEDIADGQTDPSSDYTIEAVHAAARSHVLQMSTLKKRRNRQAFLSKRSDFDDVKETSANLNSARCSLVFQDVRDLSVSGGVRQFQPWMNAAKAAGMQAAGFYKSIFNKGINISGALQAAGDFNDLDDDKVEQALDAGLLIVRRPEEGGFKYVSDQTTYGKDNNFVYNSIQAMYVADIIALTTAQRMEQAFVGQSLADISASLALTTLEGIMEDMRRLKLVTFSDDAPKGFKNAVIRITGPAMVVSVEVKEATSLYFIPITFQITQVQQSA